MTEGLTDRKGPLKEVGNQEKGGVREVGQRETAGQDEKWQDGHTRSRVSKDQVMQASYHLRSRYG